MLSTIVKDEIRKNKEIFIEDLENGDIDETLDEVLKHVEKYMLTNEYRKKVQDTITDKFGEHPFKNVVLFSPQYNKILNFEKHLTEVDYYEVETFLINLFYAEKFNYEYLTAGLHGEEDSLSFSARRTLIANKFAKKFASALEQKENTVNMIFDCIFSDKLNLNISGWKWDTSKETVIGNKTLNALLLLLDELDLTKFEIPELIQHIGTYLKSEKAKTKFYELVDDLSEQLN